MQQSNQSLAHAGAKELAASVRAKSVSALELTDAAIARIEALDGPINAVIVRDFDRARDQARAIDLRLAQGADLPLAGVPMTVKESFNVAGLPTTFGLAFAKDYRATEDAEAVQRLKDAGAIVLGKTNVAPGLADYQSDNPVAVPGSAAQTRTPTDCFVSTSREEPTSRVSPRAISTASPCGSINPAKHLGLRNAGR